MKAKKGDVVKVHYKGTLSDGSVFDSSEGREPLAFVLGQGHVIPGFDKGVEGMSIGEQKNIHIPCADAYGDANEETILKIMAGQKLVLLHPESGEPIPVTIVSAEDGVVTVDAKHPLAGEDLDFDITLETIEEVTECCGGSEGCGCQH